MNSTLTEQSPTTAADAPPARRRLVGVLVWACWAIMTAAALGYVARYGTNVPSWDDWDMVPTMTGHQPVTSGWLWSQHNEHRVPVPRLLMLALFRVLGNDFRVLMVANVAMMSGLAAALMVVARRLRGGRANLTDAFFPLLLLNWAQGLNFVWGWQVEFYVSTLLAGVVLLLVATMGPRLTVARAALITGVLWLLMMCGAHGVVLLPAMGSWLGLMAILRWFEQRGRPAENLPTGGGIGDLARGFAGPGARGERVAKPQTTTDTAGHVQDSLGRAGRGPNRREALVIALLALSVFVAAGLYFIGYEQVPYHPKGSGRRAQARTALQFLTMSFGRSVQPAWPVSGWLAMALFVATVVMLLYLVWKRPT
ncbi:MAG: hypothetical protein ACREIT_11095, partial [Tepidisphaeraceae bacterium]